MFGSTRRFLLVRDDFKIEGSIHENFSRDLVTTRIKGRFAAALPCKEKAIRKFVVDPGATTVAHRPAPADRAATERASTSSTTDYDPSDHTVADVQAHVTDHPDEIEAILAAERVGQNRSTLVADLETRS